MTPAQVELLVTHHRAANGSEPGPTARPAALPETQGTMADLLTMASMRTR